MIPSSLGKFGEVFLIAPFVAFSGLQVEGWWGCLVTAGKFLMSWISTRYPLSDIPLAGRRSLNHYFWVWVGVQPLYESPLRLYLGRRVLIIPWQGWKSKFPIQTFLHCPGVSRDELFGVLCSSLTSLALAPALQLCLCRHGVGVWRLMRAKWYCPCAFCLFSLLLFWFWLERTSFCWEISGLHQLVSLGCRLPQLRVLDMKQN